MRRVASQMRSVASPRAAAVASLPSQRGRRDVDFARAVPADQRSLKLVSAWVAALGSSINSTPVVVVVVVIVVVGGSLRRRRRRRRRRVGLRFGLRLTLSRGRCRRRRGAHGAAAILVGHRRVVALRAQGVAEPDAQRQVIRGAAAVAFDLVAYLRVKVSLCGSMSSSDDGKETVSKQSWSSSRRPTCTPNGFVPVGTSEGSASCRGSAGTRTGTTPWTSLGRRPRCPCTRRCRR